MSLQWKNNLPPHAHEEPLTWKGRRKKIHGTISLNCTSIFNSTMNLINCNNVVAAHVGLLTKIYTTDKIMHHALEADLVKVLKLKWVLYLKINGNTAYNEA